MKKIKIKFKAGKFDNAFKLTPCIQITYCPRKLETGFAVELSWFNYGIGCRFYN